MISRRSLGDFGERVARTHLEVVAFATVEAVGFSNREGAGSPPEGECASGATLQTGKPPLIEA